MNPYLIALLFFLFGYVINMFYITVFYHRALTHRALKLSPFSTWLVSATGMWVTGIDPKGWICMHRLHHLHSDTDQDPHSPIRFGMWGVIKGQAMSYEKLLIQMLKKKQSTLDVVADLPFDVHYLTRRGGYWFLTPYFLHLLLAIALGFVFNFWGVGLAYFLGMLSHPIQGWAVNSLAHRYGYENFDNHDHSKNNLMVAWLVFGEGFQNNHHHYPERANFAVKKNEFDPGYVLCKIGEGLGLLNLPVVTIHAGEGIKGI